MKSPKLKSLPTKSFFMIDARISKPKRSNGQIKSSRSRNSWSMNLKFKSLTWKISNPNLKRQTRKLLALMVHKLSAKNSESILARISTKFMSSVCWYRKKGKAQSKEFTKLSKSTSRNWKAHLKKRRKSWDFSKIEPITSLRASRKWKTEQKQIILPLKRLYESISTMWIQFMKTFQKITSNWKYTKGKWTACFSKACKRYQTWFWSKPLTRACQKYCKSRRTEWKFFGNWSSQHKPKRISTKTSSMKYFSVAKSKPT